LKGLPILDRYYVGDVSHTSEPFRIRQYIVVQRYYSNCSEFEALGIMHGEHRYVVTCKLCCSSRSTELLLSANEHCNLMLRYPLLQSGTLPIRHTNDLGFRVGE